MTHSDSDEQITQMKMGLRKYGKWILGLLVVTCVTVGAVYYVRSHSQAEIDKAASTFNQLITKLDVKKPATLKPLVAFAENENNSYGVFASLKVAQIYAVQNKDYSRATAILTQAISKTKDTVLQDILRLRIARLQVQQDLLDQSLKTLDKVQNDSWLTMANRLRGDVYLKQKQYEESVSAYQAALSSDLNEDSKTIVEMKLNHAQYLLNKAGEDSKKERVMPPSPTL